MIKLLKIKGTASNIYLLDLAKLKILKKEDSVYFKKRSFPKLVKRYNYNEIIVGGR
jgi:hypothetical protein